MKGSDDTTESSIDSSMLSLQSRQREEYTTSTTSSDSLTTVQPLFNTIGKNTGDTTPNRNNSKKSRTEGGTMDVEKDEESKHKEMGQSGGSGDNNNNSGVNQSGTGEEGKKKKDESKNENNGDNDEEDSSSGDDNSESSNISKDSEERDKEFEIAYQIIRSNNKGLSESQVLHQTSQGQH